MQRVGPLPCFSDTGHKIDMGDESSRLHFMLSANGRRLGPVWFPADLSAAVRLVFIAVAVVTVLPFKVEHCQSGRFIQRSLLFDVPFASFCFYSCIY